MPTNQATLGDPERSVRKSALRRLRIRKIPISTPNRAIIPPTMLKFLAFIFVSFLAAFAWAPALIGLLYRFNIRRLSKEELDSKIKNHAQKTGTPVMGGLLIVGTAFVLNLIFNHSPKVNLLLLILGLGALLGAADDLFNVLGHKKVSQAVRRGITPIVTLSGITWSIYKLLLLPWNAFKEAFRAMGSYQGGFKAHEKFLLQCALAGPAAWLVYTKFGQHRLWLPLLGEFNIGIFYPSLAAFLMVAYANAFSITDGLDGLSGGTHSIAFLAYGAVALSLGKPDIAIFCAILVGAELAFLYFNIFPARIEMSDVGTLPLGMVFALVGVFLNRELTLPIIGGVFTVEILSSFIQVWAVKLRGRRVFKIAPLHHHFEALGWPETKVTMRFWLAGALLAILGTLIASL